MIKIECKLKAIELI